MGILSTSFASVWHTYPYNGVTIGISEHSHPIQSLYHAQDVYGQYVYGYATPTSSKTETKTADGVTKGGYSYIDSNGILQTVDYVADPVHGFRVAATNLPQDLPDVAYAKAQHLAQYEATKAEHEKARANHIAQYSNPVVVSYNVAANAHLVSPAPVQDLPEVIKARADHLAAVELIKIRDAAIAAERASLVTHPAHISPIPTSGYIVPVKASASVSFGHPNFVHNDITTQYHAQNYNGVYSYGYAGPLSAKTETKTADGITRGGYSYIDANGILQTVHYISDPVNGFRVSGTNIPTTHDHTVRKIYY